MHFLNTLNGDFIYKHISTGYSSSSKHCLLKYSTKMSNYLKIFSTFYKIYIWYCFWILLDLFIFQVINPDGLYKFM